MSVKKATNAIRRRAGIMPRILRAKGIDMIPAPIMLVETLNTAPETDAVLGEDLDAGSRGTYSGDIPATSR